MAKRKAANEKGLVLDQARHYMRYLRSRDEKPADIARSEGVTIRAIEKSIRTVEIQQALYTQTNLNVAVLGMLMKKVNKVEGTFDRMFDAKDYIEQRNPDGSTVLIPVDDKSVQLEALKIFGSYISAQQPKSAGVSLNVQQNNANQANAVSTGKGGYEEMLHQIVKEANTHNQLPSETADVIDDEDFSEEDDDDEVMTA